MTKVLMLMMEVGSGHVMPAKAVAECILKKEPEAEIEIFDIAQKFHSNRLYRLYYEGWKVMLKHPVFFKVLYRITNRRWIQIVENAVQKKLLTGLKQYVNPEKPDVIFSTHFTCGNVVSALKRKENMDIPSALLITDAFSAHHLWIHGHNDVHIVYDQGVVPSALKKKLHPSQVQCASFPLRSQFKHEAYNIRSVRSSLNIPQDVFTLLVAFGGEGIGNVEKFVNACLKSQLPMNLIVACGRNKDMHQKLQDIVATNKNTVCNLIPKGFVDNMEQYIQASDVVLGKCGLSFTFESLIVGKPIIITQYMENEKACRDFVLKNRVGWYKRTPSDVVALLKKLIHQPGLLETYRANVENLDMKNGAEEIADMLLSMAHDVSVQ